MYGYQNFMIQDIHCAKTEVLHSGFLQYMWPNPQENADLVTFAEEILNGKLLFLYSVIIGFFYQKYYSDSI